MLKWALILGLTISVSPSVSFAPATLNAKVLHINPEGRLLTYIIVGDDFAQSSVLELHGEKTVFLPQWMSIPQGAYTVTATVTDAYGKVVQRDTTQVQVKGFEQ